MNNNAKQEEVVMEPPLYFAEEHVWNVCFHPSADVLACSEITGQIEMYAAHHADLNTILMTWSHSFRTRKSINPLHATALSTPAATVPKYRRSAGFLR